MSNNVSWPKGSIVDLTHSYSPETIYWPTEEGFKLDVGFEGITEKGYYYSAKKFSAPEHGGTHMDAPIHFAKNGKTIDQIPLDNLIGPAITIDVSKEALKIPDYQITIDDFLNWESNYGLIPDGTIVLLHTGFGRYWPDRLKYLGTDKKGKEALDDLHFPGLHSDAAQWLVENRKINAIGLDTQSIDYGKSQFFETHRILCSKNIPFFENIANLDKLPAMGFTVIALPMKIEGGSGAPLRLAAIIP
ncbi:MAG TPA: cyclase family protein [Nitrosopumilaceae archaeon]|nr:cyclase family protein [Nitrosopumilaceae archaeon]